jgi:hypothetical protein
MPVPGETHQLKGAVGARRAKRWLEATTRVKQAWTIEDEIHINRLQFSWPFGGYSFSFDLGGVLTGEEFEGHFFLAESKNYTAGAMDQGTHYDDWVAKCYVTLGQNPALADQFIWITWHPFRVTDWKKLCTPPVVKKGLLVERNRLRVFDTDDEDKAESLIDDGLVDSVAERLWVVVLSEKQERLVITGEHRSWIMAQQVLEEYK